MTAVVESTAEPRASMELHLDGRVVGLRREVLVDAVVPEHGVVVDASQVVPVRLVEDPRHDLDVLGGAPPLQLRVQSDALVQKVCSHLILGLGVDQDVTYKLDVAGRDYDDGMGPGALVECHAGASAIDHVVDEAVELEVESLRDTALRQPQVGYVEPAVTDESVAHDFVIDRHLGVLPSQRQVVSIVQQEHVARVVSERVVGNPADDVQHRRYLHRVAEVRLERVVAHREVCPVAPRHQPVARLHLDAAPRVRDELAVVDDDAALTTIVADPGSRCRRSAETSTSTPAGGQLNQVHKIVG